MIGVGIVGCNYGRTVLLPAFRTDPRCEVVALAGSDGARTAELARAVEVARGFGDWRALIEDRAVTAVAVAVPPDLQPEVARHALDLGKPVFVEKPLAADLTAARGMVEAARRSGQPTIIDFNFPELPSWRRAKEILDSGALGRLRHVVVTWNVENQATRLRLKSWKTRAGEGGGGLLGNFVSHCFYYLEWFLGPIAGLGGRVFPLPDGDAESSIALAIAFASGARRQPADELRVVSRLRPSPRILRRGRYPHSGQPDRRLFPRLPTDAGGARRQQPAAGHDRGRERRSLQPIPASHRWRGWCNASSTRASGAVPLRPASPKAIACRP